MAKFGRWLVLAAVGALVLGSAEAEEFECRFGEAVRRIELRTTDDDDRLPCQVIYWRDARHPDRSQVVWRADFNLDFCADKTRGMIENLERTGWSCTSTTPAAGPVEAVRTAPAVPQPADTTLRIALGRDLDRLERLVGAYGGHFALDQAALGDLDGDGVDDAAVLVTYDAGDDRTGRFLLAYLFRDGTFRAAAKTPLGHGATTDLALTVADGTIELADGREDGAAGEAFVLRDRRLVPVRGGAEEAGPAGAAGASPGS